jgi:hypothetical protein
MYLVVLPRLKGGAKARMNLTQVYTGARMSDMFSNYVSINPADDHALYPCDSDLFAPIDPIMVVPPGPAGDLALYIPMLRCWPLPLRPLVVLLRLLPRLPLLEVQL